MQILQNEDGSYKIERDGEIVADGLPSNAAAWREMDRLERRPNWKTEKNSWKMGPMKR